MSTHSIMFSQRNKKTLSGYLVLSGAMVKACLYFQGREKSDLQQVYSAGCCYLFDMASRSTHCLWNSRWQGNIKIIELEACWVNM